MHKTQPTLAPNPDPCTLPFERLRQAYALATARLQFPAAGSAAGGRIGEP